jgi:SpoVK/Ycf46/Vps4 family AAA+-type ATPase
MTLCPTQQKALDRLVMLWPASDVFVLWARPGLGRSTVLAALKERIPRSAVLDAASWFLPLASEDPLRIEETFVKQAMGQLERCDALLIDDFDRFDCLAGACSSYYYPRRGLARAALLTLADAVRLAGKKLVLASQSGVNDEINARALFVGWDRLGVQDYQFLFEQLLDGKDGTIDVRRVYDFAPRLSIHQIRGSLEVLKREAEITTERVIEYLEQLKMASNVDVSQVRDVALEDLKGVDDVVLALQRYVINPLSEERLAREYGVRPKRGILLFGPPGTGKTSVGRALARRLRSKFFRIDGTFITRSDEFYSKVSAVFQAAQDNAPSLIFIDDCDTIFEDRDEYGLYRYLLTMLDGLESQDMAGVSVMMTAMNLGSLPPALVRSGRIELWLEMKLPDVEARRAILTARVEGIPGTDGKLDLDALAAATEGLTGADLARLVDDARALMLADLAASRPVEDPTRIFLAAVDEVRRNMKIMAAALAGTKPPSAC